MTTEATLRRTSLYDTHRAAGGRMVPFAGWELPVQYSGVSDEHAAVRTRAGIFDVSHMGEVRIEGSDALHTVQRLVTNDVAHLAIGQGLYTPMCTTSGGIVDDLTVFRIAEHEYLLILNAATRAKDVEWMRMNAGGAIIRDVSDETALLALQGPAAEPVLSLTSGRDLAPLASFHVLDGPTVGGVRVIISRTGYTGEDGFEIACAWSDAPTVWAALLDAGQSYGLVPAGLGARDTLRLEAGLMLYGQDIDETTTPLEARLGWTVKFDKGDFVGRDALLRQRHEGVTRRLVGFEVTDRAIARHGCGLYREGQLLGQATSGTFAPFLRRSVGMGYVPIAWATPGTPIEVEIRGRMVEAKTVRLPFYRRRKP